MVSVDPICHLCFKLKQVCNCKNMSKDYAKYKIAVHTECTENGYTYNNALAEALRDISDINAALGNELINHQATIDILSNLQKKYTSLKKKFDKIKEIIREDT